MMAVEVSTQGIFSPGIPEALFSKEQVNPRAGSGYDVSADGQRFVLVQNVVGGEIPTITVVLNWYSEFKDKQP